MGHHLLLHFSFSGCLRCTLSKKFANSMKIRRLLFESVQYQNWTLRNRERSKHDMSSVAKIYFSSAGHTQCGTLASVWERVLVAPFILSPPVTGLQECPSIVRLIACGLIETSCRSFVWFYLPYYQQQIYATLICTSMCNGQHRQTASGGSNNEDC